MLAQGCRANYLRAHCSSCAKIVPVSVVWHFLKFSQTIPSLEDKAFWKHIHAILVCFPSHPSTAPSDFCYGLISVQERCHVAKGTAARLRCSAADLKIFPLALSNVEHAHLKTVHTFANKSYIPMTRNAEFHGIFEVFRY